MQDIKSSRKCYSSTKRLFVQGTTHSLRHTHTHVPLFGNPCLKQLCKRVRQRPTAKREKGGWAIAKRRGKKKQKTKLDTQITTSCFLHPFNRVCSCTHGSGKTTCLRRAVRPRPSSAVARRPNSSRGCSMTHLRTRRFTLQPQSSPAGARRRRSVNPFLAVWQIKQSFFRSSHPPPFFVVPSRPASPHRGLPPSHLHLYLHRATRANDSRSRSGVSELMNTGHVPLQRLPPTSLLWQPKERKSSPPLSRRLLPKLFPDAQLSPVAQLSAKVRGERIAPLGGGRVGSWGLRALDSPERLTFHVQPNKLYVPYGIIWDTYSDDN